MIRIQNECLTVTISPIGAEIQSVQDAQGRERMWQGNPEVWSGRAPILFPVAGGFRDDYYIWQGKKYPMNKHGFVRRREWQVESVKDTEATFLMTDKHEGFPYDYELRAVFSLEENTLVVRYLVKNKEQVPFYYSIGAHEAYLLPGGIEQYAVYFDEEERLDRYIVEGNGILPEPVCMAESTRVLPLRYSDYAVDALVFKNLRSRGYTIRGGDGRSVRVEAPDHPITMFWTKPTPDAEYLCIEPWCNGPDLVNAPYEIDKKFGFLRLEGGEEKERLHRITFG